MSDQLNNQEIVIEKKPDGTRLVRELKARASIVGMTNAELARELGMSTSYLATLFNNPDKLATMGRHFMRNIARFLSINTVMAYQYAGLLEEEDLNVEVTVDRLLAKSRDDIERDPVYGYYIPRREDWDQQSLTTRILISSLYNEVQDLRLKVVGEQCTASRVSTPPNSQATT